MWVEGTEERLWVKSVGKREKTAKEKCAGRKVETE